MTDHQSLKAKIDLAAQRFKQDGFAVIEDFWTPQEVDTIKNECKRMIHNDPIDEGQIFGQEYNQKSQYFITSGDKIRYFFEKNAHDLDTKQLIVPREQSLAKIGHALHDLNPIFHKATVSQKVKDVFAAIGFKEPAVAQSMVIFKNPRVGGAYTPHQDASFICTNPIKVAGLWFALDDANPENGCLEFIPGSHNMPLLRRWVRTNDPNSEDLLKWTAPARHFDDSEFVKVPTKSGSLVIIHGLVVHRSAENKSQKPRWIYTFHAFDESIAEYCKDNWLQVRAMMPIMSFKS